MLNLLTWAVVLRPSILAQNWPIPAAILTGAPRLRQAGLAPEVGLLLPNTEGPSGLVAGLAKTDCDARGAAFGLFLADPFLSIPGAVDALRRQGIGCIANLPSVEQQDPEFAQQLSDVGLDFAREVEALRQFQDHGFQVLAVVGDPAAAPAVAALAPLAVVVLPRVPDFAAGFPSFRKRGAVAREVREALRGAGWGGPLLGLATASEAAHETLWPDALDGVVCRPEEREKT